MGDVHRVCDLRLRKMGSCICRTHTLTQRNSLTRAQSHIVERNIFICFVEIYDEHMCVRSRCVCISNNDCANCSAVTVHDLSSRTAVSHTNEKKHKISRNEKNCEKMFNFFSARGNGRQRTWWRWRIHEIKKVAPSATINVGILLCVHAAFECVIH